LETILIFHLIGSVIVVVFWLNKSILFITKFVFYG